MALIRFADQPQFRNPWAEFERIRQGLDEISRSFLSGAVNRPINPTVYPPLNIFEDEEHLIIKAELPGFKAEDIDISLEGDTLTLQGKRDLRPEEEKISYHRREIATGSFSRAITLPTKIDPDSISATLKNGILTVTLSKAPEVRPRKISVITE